MLDDGYQICHVRPAGSVSQPPAAQMRHLAPSPPTFAPTSLNARPGTIAVVRSSMGTGEVTRYLGRVGSAYRGRSLVSPYHRSSRERPQPIPTASQSVCSTGSSGNVTTPSSDKRLPRPSTTSTSCGAPWSATRPSVPVGTSARGLNVTADGHRAMSADQADTSQHRRADAGDPRRRRPGLARLQDHRTLARRGQGLATVIHRGLRIPTRPPVR